MNERCSAHARLPCRPRRLRGVLRGWPPTYGLALLATAFFATPAGLDHAVVAQVGMRTCRLFRRSGSSRPTAVNYEELFLKLNAGSAHVQQLLHRLTISTLLAMIMGTMAAYALARFSFKGKENFALELLSIRMMPAIVSVIPLFIIARSLGVFDTPWLLIAIYALNGLPFVVWVMRVFIQDVPKSIEEAAMIDGCGRYEVFLRITLPLVLPGLAAVLVIVFMFSWNEYLFASMLTSSEAKTLPVLAANAIKPKAISWGLSSAAAVVMSLPVILLVLSAQRYLVRGLTLGAVKG